MLAASARRKRVQLQRAIIEVGLRTDVDNAIRDSRGIVDGCQFRRPQKILAVARAAAISRIGREVAVELPDIGDAVHYGRGRHVDKFAAKIVIPQKARALDRFGIQRRLERLVACVLFVEAKMRPVHGVRRVSAGSGRSRDNHCE